MLASDRVEVVLPYRPDETDHRQRALEWVLSKLAFNLGNGLKVSVAKLQFGPWVKALAVNPVVRDSSADLVVLSDADVWCDGLNEAVQQVRDGAAWAMPHLNVLRATESASDALYAGGAGPPSELEERPYRGMWGGGILVAPRQTLVDVPLDPRFVGWGQEDHAHGMALWWLAGPGWRGTADLVHLWHPPQERLNRKRGSETSTALKNRYRRARDKASEGDLSELRGLIEEAKLAEHVASEQALHDRPKD